MICLSCSGQWGDGGAGQPGWDPETSTPLPQRRPSASVPVLPGERPAPPRSAGPSALVPEGKGLYLTLRLQIQNTVWAQNWPSSRKHNLNVKPDSSNWGINEKDIWVWKQIGCLVAVLRLVVQMTVCLMHSQHRHTIQAHPYEWVLLWA